MTELRERKWKESIAGRRNPPECYLSIFLFNNTFFELLTEKLCEEKHDGTAPSTKDNVFH